MEEGWVKAQGLRHREQGRGSKLNRRGVMDLGAGVIQGETSTLGQPGLTFTGEDISKQVSMMDVGRNEVTQGMARGQSSRWPSPQLQELWGGEWQVRRVGRDQRGCSEKLQENRALGQGKGWWCGCSMQSSGKCPGGDGEK